jgi:hypothetical protein
VRQHCRGGSAGVVDRRDEAIPTLRQSFHESRCVGGVSERFAQLLHRGAEPAVEIDERLARPQPALQLIPRDQVAWPFQQRGEDLERLVGEADLRALLAQFTRAGVEVEGPEVDVLRE